MNIIAQPKQKSKNFFEIVCDFLKEVQTAFVECQKKAKNPFISLKKTLTASGKAVILKTSQESWNGDFYRAHEIALEKIRARLVGLLVDCGGIPRDVWLWRYLPDSICLGRFLPRVRHDARLRKRIAAGFFCGI